MVFNLNASIKNVEMKKSKLGNVYYTITLVQPGNAGEYFTCMVDRDVIIDNKPLSLDNLNVFKGDLVLVDLEYKPQYKTFKIIGIS